MKNPFKEKNNLSLIYSLITFVVVFALLYLLNANRYKHGMLVSVLTKGAIFSVVALSMNLLNGFTGLFSLGQAGFMSIGAYTTAILMIPTNVIDSVFYINGVSPRLLSFKAAFDGIPAFLQPYIAIMAGALIAAAVAALIGIPVLRLKSDYLAIATLGLSEIIRVLFSSPALEKITNGSYGLNRIPTFPSMLFGLVPSMITPFVIAFLCIAFISLMLNSHYGRAFKAIREDEIAAEAVGINLFRKKLLSFVVSSFFAAVAGGLLAMYMRSIEAKTFSVALTYDILLLVVIGGIGSVTGSVVGAFLVTACKEWWFRFFDSPLVIFGFRVPLFKTGFRMVVFSVVLMIVVLFYRNGICGGREFSWKRVSDFCAGMREKFKKKGGRAENAV